MRFLRRWLVILVVILTLLFIVPILLIRAQLYDGGRIESFLVPPPDCRVPCFMGVRPRHTTLQQALAILRANEEIDQVQVEYYYSGQTIFWRWKEEPNDYRRYAFQVDPDSLVVRPVLPPTLTLGDVHLALGEPEQVTAAFTNEYLPRAAVVLNYPQYGLHLFVGLYPCQINQRDFWRIHHETSVYGSFFIGLGEPNYARILPDTRLELDSTAWAKQLRDFCRTA